MNIIVTGLPYVKYVLNPFKLEIRIPQKVPQRVTPCFQPTLNSVLRWIKLNQVYYLLYNYDRKFCHVLYESEWTLFLYTVSGKIYLHDAKNKYHTYFLE